MEKRITFFQFQSIKAVAKAIDPKLREKVALQKKAIALKAELDDKKARLQKEIDEKTSKLKAEFDACEAQINALEAGIVQTIGFKVTDLVKKVIEPTGKTDAKTGKPIKVTKYLPTDIISYDEQAKEYIITIPDEDENPKDPEPECPTPETEEESFQEAEADNVEESAGEGQEDSEVADESSDEQKAAPEMPWD